MNDLLFNSDGQCYINSNLKLLSLSVIMKRRFIEMSESLEQQLLKCKTNKCLSGVQKKVQLFQKAQTQMKKKFQEVKQKMQYEYLLCNDMIYENEIRICRKQAKQKSLKQLGYFVNNTINLPQLKKTICSLNQ